MTTSRHKVAAATPRRSSYKHAFVDNLPDKLDEGTLYVSVQYATSAHNCFCGCGHEVVTPIHPTKWHLAFDGVNVSLSPSIGNWSLGCKSHYWLQHGRVTWAESLSDDKIRAVRSRDIAAQDSYFGKADQAPPAADIGTPKQSSLWRKVADWLQGK
jgi:Family of unknown function (DUF6527)